MTVNSNNIEAYILDYLEGNLDPLLTADLMAFLAENPGYERYLPDYDSSLALADTSCFPQKGILKKEFANLPEITPENFDEFCIASCEGLLDDRQITRLSDYIARHPDKLRDLELYRKIKLQPDMALQYTSRERLKKYHSLQGRHYLYYALGLAASVTLLVILTIRKPVIPPAEVSVAVNTGQALTITYPGPSTVLEVQKKAVMISPESLPLVKPRSAVPDPALTAIEPKTGVRLRYTAKPPPVSYHLSAVVQDVPDQKPYSSDNPDQTRLGALLARLDFWKAAGTAITGFNYLTESQLSVQKTTTEDGKFSGLMIGMEDYKITGK